MSELSLSSIKFEEISALSRQEWQEVVKNRRHMHQYPELSYREEKTSQFLCSKLDEYDIEYQAKIGGYGIKTIIEGNPKGPTVAIRADFDALPITEENDIPFRSQNDGVMHACGHDVHSAIVLGALNILNRNRDRLPGTVVGIFQPAEERSPGGAQAMIRDGVLDNPKVDAILGEHINPSLPAGTLGFRPNLMMASADEIYLTIHGKGGHGASPQDCIDPVAIGALLINDLQHVISRKADPRTPSVLSFGKFIGKGAMNVIPDSVYLEGTFRTVNEDWREEALQTIEELIRSLCKSFKATVDINIVRGYPVLINDEAFTGRSRATAESLLGQENIVDLPLVMWAEDFSRYAEKVPGCFYNLGIANENEGWISPLHSSTLMVDEKAFEPALSAMVAMILSELEYRSKNE